MRKLACLALLLLLLGSDAKAKTITCRDTSGGNGRHWFWREIDGRKCWYESNERLPKSELTWAVNPEQQTKERVKPAPLPRPDPPPPPVIEETKSRPKSECHPQLDCRDRPRTLAAMSPNRPMSGATLQDEPVSRPTVPPLLEEIEAETSPREQVVILEPRAMPNGMGNLHNVMANKGALVDLMHGELLTGTAGLGEEWRIPIYRWSER